MTIDQLTALLSGMTRRDICAWGAARGIVILHLTHYPKRHLVAWVAGEALRLGAAT